jgi:hypothetical protein
MLVQPSNYTPLRTKPLSIVEMASKEKSLRQKKPIVTPTKTYSTSNNKSKSLRTTNNNVSNLSNKPATITELAEKDKAVSKTQTSSWFDKYMNHLSKGLDYQAYNWVDKNIFKGYLPYGTSPTLVKIEDTRTQNDELMTLLPLSRENQILKEQNDLTRDDWYEMFGLFQDDYEKLIRQLQKDQAFNQELGVQLPNTLKEYEKVSEFIIQNPQAQTFMEKAVSKSIDWNKILIIGGLAVGGLIVLNKKIK